MREGDGRGEGWRGEGVAGPRSSWLWCAERMEVRSGRREAREGWEVAQKMTKFCRKVGGGVAELGSPAYLGHESSDSGMPRDSSLASVCGVEGGAIQGAREPKPGLRREAWAGAALALLTCRWRPNPCGRGGERRPEAKVQGMGFGVPPSPSLLLPHCSSQDPANTRRSGCCTVPRSAAGEEAGCDVGDAKSWVTGSERGPQA